MRRRINQQRRRDDIEDVVALVDRSAARVESGPSMVVLGQQLAVQPSAGARCANTTAISAGTSTSRHDLLLPTIRPSSVLPASRRWPSFFSVQTHELSVMVARRSASLRISFGLMIMSGNGNVSPLAATTGATTGVTAGATGAAEAAAGAEAGWERLAPVLPEPGQARSRRRGGRCGRLGALRCARNDHRVAVQRDGQGVEAAAHLPDQAVNRQIAARHGA